MTFPLDNIANNMIANAAQYAASSGSAKKLTTQANALATPQTNAQAKQTIDGLLSGMGMSGTVINEGKKAKIFQQLKLNGPTGGAAGKPAQQFIGMLRGLSTNRHATNAQKQHFAQLWLSTRGKYGARQALESLSGTAGFFKSMDETQRNLVAAKLGQVGGGSAVQKLAGAYAKVINNDFFHNARPMGKANALLQPQRANQLLGRWKAHKVRLPFDVKTCKKQAFNYARNQSGYRTLNGQMDLARKLMSVRDRVLFRFFEDMPTHRTRTGKSKSYADFFLDQHLKGSSWAQGAHDYLRVRKRQEQCGLFNGRASRCVK